MRGVHYHFATQRYVFCVQNLVGYPIDTAWRYLDLSILRGQDSNLRPRAYEARELTTAPPRIIER